jgi:hypothetical protein
MLRREPFGFRPKLGNLMASDPVRVSNTAEAIAE